VSLATLIVSWLQFDIRQAGEGLSYSTAAIMLAAAADLHDVRSLRVLAVFAAILLIAWDAAIAGRMRAFVFVLLVCHDRILPSLRIKDSFGGKPLVPKFISGECSVASC
jgi:hypothetical protein